MPIAAPAPPALLKIGTETVQPFSAVWTYGSTDPQNPSYFETIRQWWIGLSGQPVTWRQRLIDRTTDPADLDWEAERFDEEFVISNLDVRGITLYYRKQGSDVERSTRPQTLQLSANGQYLFIYPQSQNDVVIRVGQPEARLETIDLTNPTATVATGEGRCLLTLTDAIAGTAVRVTLNAESLLALKKLLP